MNDALAELYAVTGNPDHLRMARAFNHKAIFEPLERREGRARRASRQHAVPQDHRRGPPSTN